MTTEKITYFHSSLTSVIEILSKEVIDESENTQQTILTILSAWTEDPQNTRVLAPSGEGKTYLVNHVSDLFPQENIIKLSNATPQSFKYSSTRKVIETEPGVFKDYDLVVGPLEEELENEKNRDKIKYLKEEIRNFKGKTYDLVDFNEKCLIFLDSQSMELWNSLKANLSHDDKFIKSMGVNKSKGGVIRGQKIVFNGFPAVIYCSAKDEASQDKTNEINTRFNTISLQGNPEKYRKMMELQSLKAGLPGPIYEEEVISKKEIDLAKQLILQMIENVRTFGKEKQPILNPFADEISKQFKNDAGYRSRQLATLERNIRMLTLSHADQRPKLVIDETEHPIAIKSDIIKANELTKESPPIAISKIQFFNEKIRPAISNIGKERNTVNGIVHAVSAREIAEEIQNKNPNITTDRQRLLETYLQPLVDHGYLEEMQDPDNRRQHIFSVPARYFKEEAKLQSTFIDISTMNNLCVDVFVEKFLKCRFDQGKVKIFNKNDKEISLEELIKTVNQIDTQTSGFEPKNKIVETSTNVDIQNPMEKEPSEEDAL